MTDKNYRTISSMRRHHRRLRLGLAVLILVSILVIFTAIVLLIDTELSHGAVVDRSDWYGDCQTLIVDPPPMELTTEAETLPISEEKDDPETARLKHMLAQLVQAEAGNQPLTGMRFVVDVVLNRVDDERFPNTIDGVIYQKGQFSVIRNGAFDRAANYISEDAYRAVELEWNERLDYGVMYFSSTKDPVNGKRAFKYYDHWFSYQD